MPMPMPPNTAQCKIYSLYQQENHEIVKSYQRNSLQRNSPGYQSLREEPRVRVDHLARLLVAELLAISRVGPCPLPLNGFPLRRERDIG